MCIRDRLKTRQKLVETLRRSEQELESRVTERTDALEQANARLRENERQLKDAAQLVTWGVVPMSYSPGWEKAMVGDLDEIRREIEMRIKYCVEASELDRCERQFCGRDCSAQVGRDDARGDGD